MGLHIEINGLLEPREWRAVATIAAIMLGEEPVSIPKLAAAGLGIDADRPPAQPAVARAQPLVGPPGDTVAPPPPPAGVTPTASEALLAGEAERVAAATPPPPPMARPEGVDLDATGLPWDARIHAAAKTKTKDGAWRTRRGLGDDQGKALVTQVTAELRSIMAASVPPTAGHEGTELASPLVTDPAVAFGNAAPTSAAPDAPAGGDTPPPPPGADAPSAGIAEFARVMRVIAAKQKAGTLDTQTVTNIATALGLTGVKDLANRPDMVPAFEAMLP